MRLAALLLCGTDRKLVGVLPAARLAHATIDQFPTDVPVTPVVTGRSGEMTAAIPGNNP